MGAPTAVAKVALSELRAALWAGPLDLWVVPMAVARVALWADAWAVCWVALWVVPSVVAWAVEWAA